MNEALSLLLEGFQVALQPANLLSALIGCILGTIVGILPGLGPSTTVALLIPVAFALRPEFALIMMTGVYLGAMYGGSLTSILLDVPGEASSMMTAVDGFQLAKQGKGGAALAISAIGSFIGGTLSVVGLTFLAPSIAQYALLFGPAEMFSLMLAALLFTSALLGDDLLKGLAAVALGLVLAMVGTDLQTGAPRLTLGIDELLDGIDEILLLMGVFGVGEVLWHVSHRQGGAAERLGIRGRLWPDHEDWRRSWPAILRGSVVGFLAGILPGSGSSLGSLMAYTLEKRVSRQPERFGRGAIEGVAASETANNAATGGAMIPMFTLGVPGSGTTAVLLVALMMYGIQPGPRLMIDHPDVIWGTIAALYVSNVILLILNLPLIGIFTRILDVPVRILMPLIIAIAAVGAYALHGSLADVIMLFVFGLLGYGMRALGIPQVPLVLGAILGPRMEQSLRQALLLSNGDWSVLVDKPISAAFLAAGVGLVLLDAVTRRHRIPTAA
ncbi:tripartite tricarboxylate transporter permease [Thermaerobacter sp. FW80]|uniref:tripartite tricarboxylate transporter permease n=1 Tax=Thermaerobacter sp. FW80 TaxID=2546351 RepID=UPI00107520CA|nr:tripartite tricarboxylate transporter permease [Thermaerobacter sp. FW80]QBS36683.1 tripartite tricarboxylate transporter permease [Thermaerobacter sp. FW80]